MFNGSFIIITYYVCSLYGLYTSGLAPVKTVGGASFFKKMVCRTGIDCGPCFADRHTGSFLTFGCRIDSNELWNCSYMKGSATKVLFLFIV